MLNLLKWIAIEKSNCYICKMRFTVAKKSTTALSSILGTRVLYLIYLLCIPYSYLKNTVNI